MNLGLGVDIGFRLRFVAVNAEDAPIVGLVVATVDQSLDMIEFHPVPNQLASTDSAFALLLAP